jgi:sugar lactone lactonase YvrE
VISKQTLTVFSNVPCELGEGPLWHPQRQSLFWLDILEKILYEKNFYSQKADYDQSWVLPWTSSALAMDATRNDILWIVTEHSFGQFNLVDGRYTLTLDLPVTEAFRTNDGGVSPAGEFWFGTMEKHPTGQVGTIYSITSQGQLVEQLTGIGIPNTFVWLNNGQQFLLSDSLRQCMLSFQIHEGCLQKETQKTYLDLHLTGATPDGGAVDQNGNLWNAHWDGYSVVCYDGLGRKLQYIDLPIPKPTSCCFGGPENRHLFITSAREGMTKTDVSHYPLSGNVFLLELPVAGAAINPFRWEPVC